MTGVQTCALPILQLPAVLQLPAFEPINKLKDPVVKELPAQLPNTKLWLPVALLLPVVLSPMNTLGPGLVPLRVLKDISAEDNTI